MTKQRRDRRPVLHAACRLLERELAHGPQPYARLKARALAEHISEMTLHRAARELGIARSGSARKRQWALQRPTPASLHDAGLWLCGYLCLGPRPALEVLEAAREAGLDDTVIYQAVLRLGVERGWGEVHGRLRWCFSWPEEEAAPGRWLLELIDRYRRLIEREHGAPAFDWLEWEVAIGCVLADLCRLAGTAPPADVRGFLDEHVMTGGGDDDVPF